MHGLLYSETHLVSSENLAARAKELLKLNNTINTCLIRPSIISYYSLSLHTCECLILQIFQYNSIRLKIYTHLNLKIIH